MTDNTSADTFSIGRVKRHDRCMLLTDSDKSQEALARIASGGRSK